MGFEIKNICTVVPNPYYPNYRKNDGKGLRNLHLKL